MENSNRIALLAFLASFTIVGARAEIPPALTETQPVVLSDLGATEVVRSINYPGLNGERGCLFIEAAQSNFNTEFFSSQIRAYDGARFLFGSLEYAVSPLKFALTGPESIVIGLTPANGAYLTGISIQTREVGESFANLVRRSTRGSRRVDVELRLGRCPSVHPSRF